MRDVELNNNYEMDDSDSNEDQDLNLETDPDLIENMKYVCPCGYVYDETLGDPKNGVAPGTKWEDVPEDWVCPVCGLGKDAFEEE